MQTNENLNLAAIRLFGYSFLILFFELALIRFIPATVQIASYFINLVLIATFLGMGTGLILQQRNWNLSKWFAPVLLLLLVICQYFANVIVEKPSGLGEYLWSTNMNQPAGVRKFGIVPVISTIFIASTLLFIPLGIELGRNFAKFPSLISYSINVFGSLIGLIFFGALSYFSTPPVLWFALGFGFEVLLHDLWLRLAGCGVRLRAHPPLARQNLVGSLGCPQGGVHKNSDRTPAFRSRDSILQLSRRLHSGLYQLLALCTLLRMCFLGWPAYS